MQLRYFLDNLWRNSCNLQEIKQRIIPSYESLIVSEWSPLFEKLMRNRLIMGAIRYGLLHDKNKPKYDRVSSAITRLQKYKETGNLEFLVDVANMCLLEFEEGEHINKHFSSIDDGEHVKIK